MYAWSALSAEYESGMVAKPARGQLNRKNIFSRSSFGRENLVSQDRFGRLVPRQPAHSPIHTQAESSAYSRDSSRFPDSVHVLYRRPPSGQSRVYRVVQFPTDSIHCQESIGTGLLLIVVLRVVPVTGAAPQDHHGSINNVRLSFPTPTIGMYYR